MNFVYLVVFLTVYQASALIDDSVTQNTVLEFAFLVSKFMVSNSRFSSNYIDSIYNSGPELRHTEVSVRKFSRVQVLRHAGHGLKWPFAKVTLHK